MKKNIFVAIIILAFSLTFFGCTKADPNVPSGMQLASNTDLVDYYLYVPQSWTVDLNNGVTSARASDIDSSNVNVVVTDLSDTTSENAVADYWALYKPELEKYYDDGKITMVTDGEKITFAAGEKNISAAKYVYTAKLSGSELKYMQVISYYKNRFYIITLTASSAKYEANAESFNDIVENFKFKG